MLDGVGGERGRAALGLLRDGGRIAVFGWSSGEPTALDETDLARRGHHRGPGHWARASWSARAGCAGSRRRRSPRRPTGGWSPLLNAPFTLAEAARAHAALERRGTVGKVVLYA